MEMLLVTLQAAGGDSVGEVGGGLFEFEEPLEMDDEPISKPTIKLNGVRVCTVIQCCGYSADWPVATDISVTIESPQVLESDVVYTRVSAAPPVLY